jgi:integrase
MLGEGVDFKVMQTRLGHSDIRTTMNTYAHTLPSMNKEAGEKLDTMMFGDKKNIG